MAACFHVALGLWNSDNLLMAIWPDKFGSSVGMMVIGGILFCIMNWANIVSYRLLDDHNLLGI